MHSVARNVVGVCLAVMVLLVVMDVAGRSILGAGLPGTVEINEYLLVVIGFIGIFQTYHEKGHISVDLLFTRLPERVRQVLARVDSGLILIFSLMFFYAGAERFWSAFKTGETNWFGAYVMPVWFVRLVIPIGCLALCIQSLMNMWQPENGSKRPQAGEGEKAPRAIDVVKPST